MKEGSFLILDIYLKDESLLNEGLVKTEDVGLTVEPSRKIAHFMSR